MSNGYEHAGYWIEEYEHIFPNAATGSDHVISVWRVRTKEGGAILSKHLPSEENAKKLAEEWARRRKQDQQHS